MNPVTLVVVAALAVTCSADLLAPRQQAPQNAYSSGGGDFLGGPRNTYIPPSNQYLPPAKPTPAVYLPPPQPSTPAVYLPPKPMYLPPPTPSRPTGGYLPPKQSTPKPSGGYLPPQTPGNSYLPPSGKPVTPPVPILKQINELNADGSFNNEILTGDQTHIKQMGHIENLGTDHEEQVMHGSYSYVGDDGKTYTVTYVADANGFRPVGDHLPTPPPIPEAIQKALEQNAAEEAAQGYPSGNQGYPSGPAGYPSGPSGYPSGPAGYPSGPTGYPSAKPPSTYIPPQQPNKPNQPGYYY